MMEPNHEEFLKILHHAVIAHQEQPNQPGNALRYWDGKTPYVIHPIWCAVTLLHETKLPDTIRLPGYQVLLLHDVLEDTRMPLPGGLDPLVVSWVDKMTYESLQQEMELIWDQPDVIKLLKLYDKTSILLDAVWMSPEKWNLIVKYTLELADFVERTYGDLTILRFARVLAVPK